MLSCESETSNPGEFVAGDEVGNAGHGVRTVNRGGALLQDLDAVDRDGGKGVDVDEAAAEQPRRQRRLAAAVEQHQGPRRPEAPEVHVGDALGHCRPLVVVPTVRLADDAGRGGQVLDQIDRLQRPLLLLDFPVQHLDRVGKVDRRFLDRRTGDDHYVVGVEVEDAVLLTLVVLVVVILVFLEPRRIDRRRRGGFGLCGIGPVFGSEGTSPHRHQRKHQQDQHGLGDHFASLLRL